MSLPIGKPLSMTRVLWALTRSDASARRASPLSARPPASAESFDGSNIGNDDQALPEPNEPGRLPDMKLLVHTLPGSTNHAGKFLLGDAQGDARDRVFCSDSTAREAEQRLGQPPIDARKDRVLNLLVGLPQAVTEHPEKQHTEVGPTFQKRDEFATIEHQQFAIRDRARISGSLLTIEQCDFTEDLARIKCSQHKLAARR